MDPSQIQNQPTAPVALINPTGQLQV